MLENELDLETCQDAIDIAMEDNEELSSEVADSESIEFLSDEQSESVPTPENIDVLSETERLNVLNADMVNEIGSRIGVLEKLFETKILQAEHEAKIIDRMHEELQKHREDLYSQLLRPIIMDVIRMRDNILNVVEAYLEKPEGEQFIPVATVAIAADEAQFILESNNVEVYRSDVESKFVPLRQKALKKITVNDQNLHGKVAKSLSDGYSYNGRTMSPEKVALYYYEKPASQADNSEEEIQNV